jgi:hypothetical protein
MTFNFGNTAPFAVSPVGLLIGAFFVGVGWYTAITACRWIEGKLRGKKKTDGLD